LREHRHAGGPSEPGPAAGNQDLPPPSPPPPPPPPVIILAAFADGSEVARARQLGVREVIPKARFSFDELLHRIRSHLAPGVARPA
jgi:DNA-binding NarL/FixJ family response regulator